MRPTTIITNTLPMNRYVGIANAFDDSLTPRRLMAASTMTNAIASSTRNGSSSGTAEMMLSTPDATDTTTVMT